MEEYVNLICVSFDDLHIAFQRLWDKVEECSGEEKSSNALANAHELWELLFVEE
jgi:phosphoribulokinase